MALISMTGFGRGDASSSGVKVEVEISSVNRKQFDARISLPRGLSVLESRIYELIHKSVRRGYVQGLVKVSSAGNGKRSIKVDMAAAEAYVGALRQAAKKLNITDDVTVRSLVSLPDVIRVESAADDTSRAWPLVKRSVTQALRELRQMEKTEGVALEQDILARMKKLEQRLRQIERAAPKIVPRYRELLRKRLAEAGVKAEEDRQGLWKEVVVFADRCDISEEITRLKSHFAQTRDMIDGKGPSGRALDFLCQEMFREINTIGSKANDATIASYVVHFKTGLETVREQVQNVE